MSAARVTGESLSFDVMRLCTCVRSEALCPKDHFVYKLNGMGASGVRRCEVLREVAGSPRLQENDADGWKRSNRHS